MRSQVLHALAVAAFLPDVSALSVDSKRHQVPTVYLPLNFKYGANEKISTDIVLPGANKTITAVYDQGSENFFVFGPHAIDNWGCTSLLCQGPCNITVDTFYDPSKSSTASREVPFQSQYIYGSFDKVYKGDTSVNDTIRFTNDAQKLSTVPNVRFALADYLQQRQYDNGKCIAGPYDRSILGVAPVQYGPAWNTTGPSIRDDLLKRGVISTAVQSLWFDKAPSDVKGTYTGGGLFGGIDTSKFTGPLVKVPLKRNTSPGASVGYYVPPPTTSVNGVILKSIEANTINCLIDSGTHNDDLPVASDAVAAFFAATGIKRSPAGYIAWPGKCETIPANITIDLAFAGVNAGETATVKIPLRAYARNVLPEDETSGYCTLSVDFGGCVLGAPFATAAFFAADDERKEIALAQGGVSTKGASVDVFKVVDRIL